MTPALFNYSSDWETRFAWQRLLEKPTTVHSLSGPTHFKSPRSLFVKREDETDTLYGGNKVRNLEFLLGEVIRQGYKRVRTLGPLGSNFIAALAAQAYRVGVAVHVDHFIPVVTPQIQAHADFSLRLGTEIALYPGRRGAVPAYLAAKARALGGDSYFLTPGGSHPLGVLGHVSAFLELGEQVARGEAPRPSVIVVGVGTCGTLAGLLIGRRLLGWNTRIIGVRCVDRIVCHPRKVRRLANQTLRLLGRQERLSRGEVEMVDLSDWGLGDTAYGLPLADFEAQRDRFLETYGLRIDSTYTGKVARFLEAGMEGGQWAGKHVLYWHTFSPKALESKALSAAPRVPVTRKIVLHSLGRTGYLERHDESHADPRGKLPVAKLEEWSGRNP